MVEYYYEDLLSASSDQSIVSVDLNTSKVVGKVEKAHECVNLGVMNELQQSDLLHEIL